MRKIKLLIIFLFLCLLLFVLLLVKYQKLANEGSAIEDEHCIKVNPLIIDRKNKYRDEMDLMVASASSELVEKALNAYIASAKGYLKGEEEWLTKDKVFLDSWDFKLLNLPYPEIKKMFTLQHQIYQLEYDGTKIVVEMWKKPRDFKEQIKLVNALNETMKKQDALQEELGRIWENSNNHGNEPRIIIKSLFIKLPLSKCPPENRNIQGVPLILTPTPTVNVKELEFNKEELESYYKIYQNPFVIAIRTALNNYLKGNYKDLGFDQSEIDSVVKTSTTDGILGGLDSFDKSYYQSKFIVVEAENSAAGGQIITIMFQDKQDKLFVTWVYNENWVDKLAVGKYVLREFMERKVFNGKSAETIRKELKRLLDDKEHAL